MVGAEESKTAIRLNTRTIVVVPCYNEEFRFPQHDFAEFAANHHDIGFLLVDDGSTDRTRASLESLQKLAPASFFMYPLPKNKGKGEAVRQGLLQAISFEPEFVCYWDADLATPLDELHEFISIASRSPEVFLVMGSRVQRLGSRIDRSLWRHCVGRVFASLASSALKLSVYDTQCGAKLMRADVGLQAALAAPFHGRWIFDIELIQRLSQQPRHGSADRCGTPAHPGIVEVPLTRWIDVPGSKVSVVDGLWAFFQLARIWIATRMR
jgi:dolichyl-phosphate beta-glucosyltransferase